MPCYDSRDDPSSMLKEAREDWMHNSPVAEMLCWAMTMLDRAEVSHIVTPISEAADAWWAEHKARDKLKEQFSHFFREQKDGR